MYKLTNNLIKRLSDGASIPLVNGNKDYEEYKQWLSQGNIPEPEFTEQELKEQEIEKAKQEAIDYLNSTDFKMLPDYFETLTKSVQTKLIKARAEARKLLK